MTFKHGQVSVRLYEQGIFRCRPRHTNGVRLLRLPRPLRALACCAPHAVRAALYGALSVLAGADSCLCCGKPTRSLPLCAACADTLSRYEGLETRCARCGRVLLSESGTCTDCRRAERDGCLSFCFPIFAYRLWRQELVFAWKTRGNRLFTPLLAGVAVSALENELRLRETGAAVVPVPPRPGKIRSAGWDQVEDLCRWLETRHKVPVQRLLRRRSAQQQKRLNSGERRENARRAFCLSGRAERMAARRELPARIILLDDIRTTGATLDACASTLSRAGVADIRALVLFGAD
ncbi:ComF family protein [Treponema endosymbiont of Eucomonympha sp.]|uniref:ComF family protein n=1 Tax=Treponema endosymbiont of Eucomonympha sp. TaxID=1580831 RepID=UPI000B2758BF|nr:ComF family protein [Treponema endosymbiont of Eucomonympha sp.]